MKDIGLIGFFRTSSVFLFLSRLLKKAWVSPLFFGAGYFAFQFTQIGMYGVSWDEPLHRNWGKLFMHFWRTGDRLALELMPGHGIEYGPIFYVANYLFSEWAFARGLLTFVEANHVLTLLAASLVVALTYVLGRMIGGWKTGAAAAFFLVFFPQFLAHSHYNPKDIPLMAAVLVTAILFLRAIRTATVRSFVLAAFFMGIAIALKISALIMAPVFLVTYLLWLYADKRAALLRGLRSQAIVVGLSMPFVFVGAFVFWPSAWGDPLVIVHSVRFFLGTNFWPGQVLYFGTEYGGAALPWHYIPFEFFAATPVLTLIAFVVGGGVLMGRMRHRTTLVESVFLALWIAVPIGMAVLPGIVRYDGIRQFFFVVPPMCVLAACGLRQLLHWLKGKGKHRFTVPVFLLFVGLSLAGETVALHPFEGSYRNEVIRMMYPKDMDHVFQIEYWGATYLQGMDWLIEHAEPDPVICVPTAGILVTWYPWRPDFTFDCSDDANYVMFFTRYSEAKEYDDLQDPVFTISRMNASLLDIYKIK